MKKEIQVNVLDLIKYMCKQWKKLFIGGLCGMIFVSAIYCVVGLTSAADKEKENQTVDNLQTVETLREQLTEEEVVEVEQALDFYLTSQENYELLKVYTVNSLIYKIDAANTPTYRLVYSIKAASTTSEDIQNGFGVVYENWIKSDEAIQMILDQTKLNFESVYVKELISCSYDEITKCFTIIVVSPDKETTELLATAIDVTIQQNAKDTEEKYSEIAIEKLIGVASIEVNNSIQSKQYSMMQQLHAAKSVLTAYRYELSNEQQAYYTALLTGEVEGLGSTTQTEEVSLFNIKITILGAIAGTFVMIFVVLLQYLLSDTLKVKEDITQTFNKHVFGEFVISKMCQNDWKLLCENIKYTCKKKSVKKLLIAGTHSDAEISQLEQQLSDALKDDFMQIDIALIEKDNADIVEYIKNQDAILCVEKIQKSSYTNIQHEIEIYEYYEIPVLGFVLIK